MIVRLLVADYLPRKSFWAAPILVVSVAIAFSSHIEARSIDQRPDNWAVGIPISRALFLSSAQTAAAQGATQSAAQPPQTTPTPPTPTSQPPQTTPPPTTPTTEAPQTTQPPTAPATQPAATQPARRTTYSREAVVLVVLILLLLTLLFWFLFKWSHRLDQASYLGSVYQESVEDFEYKRLATVPTEKLQKGDYHREIEQERPAPVPPTGFDPWLRRPWGAGGPGPTPPPPGLPGLGSGFPGGTSNPFPEPEGHVGPQRGDGATETPEVSKERLEAEKAWKDYERKRDAWQQEVNTEANARYKRDLDAARTKAVEQASKATDVDLSVLRGRGAEFVLEFTTIVVIIFAAVVLGVLDILGTEQIGTLLAAIAGYVLGRASSRGRSTSMGKTAEGEKKGQKDGAGE